MSENRQKVIKSVSTIISTVAVVASTVALIFITVKIGKFLDGEANDECDQDDSVSSDSTS